jgi:hypothetical protein
LSSHIKNHNNINKMSADLPANGHSSQKATGEDKFTVKSGLARMLKGGVIMDVVNAEQVLPISLPALLLPKAVYKIEAKMSHRLGSQRKPALWQSWH